MASSASLWPRATRTGAGRPLRVGFLFNHYAPHQVPHAAPYAFELSRRQPSLEVTIACATAAEETLARRIGDLYPGHRVAFVRLRPRLVERLIDPLVAPHRFARKRWILRHNLDFFRGLDALVAPERHCYLLRSRYGLEDLKLIHTRHGAGDREGGFDERSGAFDLTLLPGRKYVDRLSGMGLLQPGRWAVTGWPKFEVVRGLGKGRQRLFENDRPVVVYNPHFDQRVASWARLGEAVLDFFRRNPAWNLIFAPHVVLFRRHRRHGAKLPRWARTAPNILIDTGSERSADMTYMLAADIYLGDVSSQVYEFLLRPRPCIFLDAHGVAWRDDPSYLHWTMGDVVRDVGRELGPALEAAAARHAGYRPHQEELFAYTFHEEPGSTAAERGADAIARFLATGRA
ncbi:hypothetical protein [Benzoatithermus flavus]|uniref:Glycerophosphotransferase n=1 Tax=Benzoatithermus flavus TaxID=3108223 RepID=A0ABU8XY78_9PROT